MILARVPEAPRSRTVEATGALSRRPRRLAFVLAVAAAFLAVAAALLAAAPATAATPGFTYDAPAYPYAASVELSSPNTATIYLRGSPSGPEVASWGRSASTRGCCVAANTAEAAAGGVVRHYTTNAAAQSISKSGTIEPGLSSGRTWLTPDRYASGAEAQARLALNKTPDGYFEIPMCRVQCPSGPSRVEPFYGQPGGGTEITTRFPIDVTDLPFIKFE